MTTSMIEISTDRSRLDIAYIHRYLSEECYWSLGRSRAVVEKSIANSLCFGVYDGDRQIGFARVVTDYATFAWLCDVFVDAAYRGQGDRQTAGGDGDGAPRAAGDAQLHPGDARRTRIVPPLRWL